MLPVEQSHTFKLLISSLGLSTFLGIVVTAFASSKVFRIIFKMFTGVVLLGLLHGLCFLPVWLSILCRRQITMRPGVDDVEKNTNVSSAA